MCILANVGLNLLNFEFAYFLHKDWTKFFDRDVYYFGACISRVQTHSNPISLVAMSLDSIYSNLF